MRSRKPFARRSAGAESTPNNVRRSADGPVRKGTPPGSLWLWGQHPVLAALRNPRRRRFRLLLTAEARQHHAAALPAGLQAETCERAALDQILPAGAVHQGMAVQVAPLEEPDLVESTEPLPGQDNLVVVLDQVTDPHNVGAVLRSCAAFGARALVLTDRNAPEVSGVLAKSASGATELVPLVRVVNLARALDQLAELGYWRIGLDGTADKTLAEAGLSGNVALVLGAEGAGLRRLTTEKCDLLAKLPIRPEIDSLNVSNAAACALYELARGGR